MLFASYVVPEWAWFFLAFWILTVVGIIGVMFWQWRKAQPKVWVQVGDYKVGLRYLGDAKPWPGWDVALEALLRQYRRNWPSRTPHLMDFWIDILPPGDLVSSSYCPSGTCQDSTGKWIEIGGTIDVEAHFLGLWKKNLIRIRQPKTTPLPDVGSPASDDAWNHEAAAHHTPFCLEGKNPNFFHDAFWKKFQTDLEAERVLVSIEARQWVK